MPDRTFNVEGNFLHLSNPLEMSTYAHKKDLQGQPDFLYDLTLCFRFFPLSIIGFYEFSVLHAIHKVI